MHAASRCSAGSPLIFRWFGFPVAQPGQDTRVARSIFLAVVFEGRESTSDDERLMAGAEFSERLALASNGKLRAPREVRPINPGYDPPLFEIRWQGLPSRRPAAAGIRATDPTLVRMYFSEPIALPEYFIGHHIHRKQLRPQNLIRVLQDAEIGVATNFYYQGEATRWGIEGVN